MKKIFEMVIPNTVSQIYEALHKNVFSLPGSMAQVLNRPFRSFAEIYDSLDEHDPLTNMLYTDRDGQGVVYFPLNEMAVARGVLEAYGDIGDQNSDYHKETLKQHVSLVAYNLVQAGVSEREAVLYAVLHDYGKKYTAETDEDGEIDFPDHEILSAFIGGYYLLNNCYVDGDALRKHIAVILGHLFPYCQQWQKYPYRKDKTLREITPCFECPVYAEEAVRMIEILDASDEGCSSYDAIEKAQDRIRQGESIIRHMTEFSDF